MGKIVRAKKKLIAAGCSVAAVAVLLLLALYVYELRDIKVTGNELVPEDVIIDNYTDGLFGRNKLIVLMKDKLGAFDELPFVREHEISFDGNRSMTIRVYEKALVACFYYMGEYVFFDKDGMILETGKEAKDSIPCIEGVSFKSFTMNTKIDVDNEEQISMILNISELINHYSLNVQKVSFDNNSEVTLNCDGIVILLGRRDMYDQQIASVSDVLKKAEKKKLKGTIDLRTYEKGDKIIFKEQN